MSSRLSVRPRSQKPMVWRIHHINIDKTIEYSIYIIYNTCLQSRVLLTYHLHSQKVLQFLQFHLHHYHLQYFLSWNFVNLQINLCTLLWRMPSFTIASSITDFTVQQLFASLVMLFCLFFNSKMLNICWIFNYISDISFYMTPFISIRL